MELRAETEAGLSRDACLDPSHNLFPAVVPDCCRPEVVACRHVREEGEEVVFKSAGLCRICYRAFRKARAGIKVSLAPSPLPVAMPDNVSAGAQLKYGPTVVNSL